MMTAMAPSMGSERPHPVWCQFSRAAGRLEAVLAPWLPLRAVNPNGADLCDGEDSIAMDESTKVIVTTCGVGAMTRNGRGRCVNGEVVDSCTAGQPALTDVGVMALTRLRWAPMKISW